ncbi:hypothetical protein niasHT_021622 [Heterodera trifolii]|uniref:non-specific serine/threonine protein kinase n=1 Tax=Heterodera trifolii TaxID=157864 RepID=A0ABD2JT94_9BILA
MRPTPRQPSTHLRRLELLQPHVQLDDFKKKEKIPCPQCGHLLDDSKKALSNHNRSKHKAENVADIEDDMAAEKALRRANAEHETESSDVDEDDYVVESDDDIPVVEVEKPRVGKVTKHTVDLSWIRPPHDGGAPIDGYVIEQRKMGDDDWTRANIGVPGAKTVRDTRCTVKGLPEKKQFEFRVRAVNEAGEGLLSMTSDLVFTTDQPGRPVFDLSNLKDTTVRAGETTTITLPCSSGGLKPNVDVLNDDSSDQPSSSTARRREPRKQKSARKDAIELTPLDIQCCSKNLTLPRPKNTERTASGSGRRRVGSTAADRPAQAASAACAAGEEAPDDRDKVPGEPPVTVDGKTKYGAENESREKPRLAKRTKESASAGRSLRVRGQTSGEPVVLNFDRTRAELELVAPASNCCINVLTPVRPSQRGKCGRSRANTANAGAALAASCEDRFLKPQIITAQRKWKVRAGRTLSLCIKFVGTPDPSVCWVKAGGAGTLPPELIMEEHIKGNTSIFFPAAKRSESGTYELRLKNNIGETEGHFEVLVQDRPAPPKRPLAVDNVARDSCTLSWQPPEDDGGSEVTNYVVECRDVGSQVWLPVNNVVGTNSTVPNLQEGHEYQFRVCAVNAFGCSDPLNTDSDVLAMDPYDPPGRPEVTHHDNNQISIKWAPSTDTGGSPIAHYDVQRKDAKTRRWIKVEKPRVGKVTKHTVDLSWIRPPHDGGAPIDGYVIEQRKMGDDDWTRANIGVPGAKTVRDTRCTVKGLPEKKQFEFRVRAVNEAGEGLLSMTSDLVFTTDQPGRPVFDLSNLKDTTVRAGETTTITLPCSSGGLKPNVDVLNDDSSDQPSSSTARRREPRKQKSARKDAIELTPLDIQCCSKNLTLPRPKNTERTASGSGRRRVGSTAAARQAQAAAAACAADEEATDEAKLKKRHDMSIRALKRRSVRSSTFFEKDLAVLLEFCGQQPADVVSWRDFEASAGSFNGWSKIGEGAFGEVFKGPLDGVCIVLKVIPFAVNEDQCLKLVNGDHLKPAKFVFNELFITNELSKLSDAGNDFVTPSFTQLRMSKVVKGCLPSKLLKAWDDFKKAKPELVENDRPDIYAHENLHFAIIGLSYGGKDLEKYTIKNGRECYSIFHQIALSLAIAEDVLEFEHRDLHAGNILVEQCSDEKIRYVYRGEQIDVVSNGVRASIIDFSISRLNKNGVRFVDLSHDNGLFEQNGVSDGGDYQYDVYRLMKAAVNEKWAKFWPQTNVLWMGNQRPTGRRSRKPPFNSWSARCSQPDATKPTCAGGQQRQQKQYDKRQRRVIRSNGSVSFICPNSAASSKVRCPNRTNEIVLLQHMKFFVFDEHCRHHKCQFFRPKLCQPSGIAIADRDCPLLTDFFVDLFRLTLVPQPTAPPLLFEPFLQMDLSNMNQEVELLTREHSELGAFCLLREGNQAKLSCTQNGDDDNPPAGLHADHRLFQTVRPCADFICTSARALFKIVFASPQARLSLCCFSSFCTFLQNHHRTLEKFAIYGSQADARLVTSTPRAPNPFTPLPFVVLFLLPLLPTRAKLVWSRPVETACTSRLHRPTLLELDS